jgi:hypothetical protein
MRKRTDPKTSAIAYTIEAHPRGYRLVMLYATKAARAEGSYKPKSEIDRYVGRYYKHLPRVADRFSSVTAA